MGDRANVCLRDNEGEIYLYTHWAGSELPERVRVGLDFGRPRWDDPSYLNRIIFQAVLNGDVGTTGYGLSVSVGDGDDRVLVVAHGSRLVYIEGRPDSAMSFEDFVAHGISWDGSRPEVQARGGLAPDGHAWG